MLDSPSLSIGINPAAQYLRVSSDNQRYSLKNQEILIARYAAEKNFRIVQSYEDAGLSGLTIKRREGLQALLRDVLAGQTLYRTILVVDVSRWGRFQDPDEAAHYEFLCRQSGVRVEYCAELFSNDGSSSAVILKTLKRVMAADYSRQLSDRTSAGKRRQVALGFAGGGATPYGVRRRAFNKDGSPAELLSVGERRRRLDQSVRWVRGPLEETRVIRTIFRLFVKETRSMAAIAAYLNSRGVTYVGGLTWTDWRVKSVLCSETAVGNYVYNKEGGQFAEPGRKTPPEEWLRIKVLEPIVSVSQFRSAQRRLRDLRGCWLTDDEMLVKLRAFRKRHGRLSARLMRRFGARPCVSAYVQRFGSLKIAFARIGCVDERYPRRTEGKEKYEANYITRRLRDLYNEKGYVNTKLLESTSDLPSPTYIARQFGSITNAYILAGIDKTRSEVLAAARRRRGEDGNTQVALSEP